MEDYFKPYKRLAEKWGYEFECFAESRQIYLGRLSDDPMLNNKFCYFTNDRYLFWAFDSFGAKFGMHQTYSGVYRWVKLPEPAFECRMEKFFRLDVLLKGKRNRLGIPEVDKKVTIHTNNKTLAGQFITPRVVKDFLSLNELAGPLELVIGNQYIPRFKGHENEQLIGMETNRWYTAGELETNFKSLTDFLGRFEVS